MDEEEREQRDVDMARFLSTNELLREYLLKDKGSP